MIFSLAIIGWLWLNNVMQDKRKQRWMILRRKDMVLFFVEIGKEGACAFLLRILDDLLRGALFDDDAIGHENHAIRDVFGEFDFMRDDNHRHVHGGEFADDFQNFASEFGIEGGGRFVEEENLRVVDKGAGDGDALLLTAGELERIEIFAIRKSHLRKELACFRDDFVLVALLDGDRRVDDVFQNGIKIW